MARVGVKYCGGCNPRFDRGELARKLRERYPQLEWENAKSGVFYDLLVVLCGCSAECASLDGLESRRDPIWVNDPSGLAQVEQILSQLQS